MTDNEVTTIDVFELPAANIGEFIENWRDLGGYLTGAAGFRAARLHRAIDSDVRFPVVDFARWDTTEQATSALQDPRRQQWSDALPADVRATTALYETIYDFRPPTDREFDGPGVTFMNIFEISPDAVDSFAVGWSDRARLMRSAPGFRDVRLHRAVTAEARFRLVNIAHWDSVAAWRAAAQNSTMTAATGAARTHATPNTAIYEIVSEVPGSA
ncbi:antibiotic biosynthesis monooxygenase [Nocardia sp. NBC_00508]|uniref:antibiotic biosynthesis monooxygenase family protein n=1 Tax=Nocardia sp. NBC_00508 TaxID=2975992 RepID=UPI002E820713|nr:antibiotic biosynthesis monooxygenase family protein [Nocardia sp. NBC_00508]WUD66272.1 antibiotic biosynthesis monooxygenase [Nocardia sp. NBC_00508]